jgi:thiosulfate reductase cytochrome b subunit
MFTHTRRRLTARASAWTIDSPEVSLAHNGAAAYTEGTMKASIRESADAQPGGQNVRAGEPRGVTAGTGKAIVHPLWLRITHWLNALAAIIMVLSGWRIYDASPVFKGFMIPLYLTLGGWLAGALQWHFAAMWLLMVNGLVYLGLNLSTGRMFTKFFPLTPRAVFSDLSAALTGRLHHDDLRRYNAVQKLAYLVVIVDLIVLVLSGLAIWKSVQFPSLRWLMGGYDTARIVHFCAMAVLVAFFVVHVVMVAIVPRSLLAMLRGR